MEPGRTETTEISTSSNLTNLLVVREATVNTDYTEYPFETRESRARLVSLINDAAKKGQVIMLIDSDLDRLKQLNDVCANKHVANLGITEAIDSKRRKLEELGLGDFLVWRPQAGGDEFKIMFFLNEHDDTKLLLIQEQIRLALTAPTPFIFNEQQPPFEITCSFGIETRKPDPNGDAALELAEMEKNAETKMAVIKLSKIELKLLESIQSGRISSIEEYKQSLKAEWGPTRITPNILGVILDHYEAKIISRLLDQRNKLHI